MKTVKNSVVIAYADCLRLTRNLQYMLLQPEGLLTYEYKT